MSRRAGVWPRLAVSLCLVTASVLAFGTPGSPAVASEEEVVVEVSKLGFSPANLNIETGTTVVWRNTNLMQYPVVGGSHILEADDGSFESSPIAPGASWSMRFLNPGTISYRDRSTPSNTGRITVTGDPVAPPALEKDVAIVEPNPGDPDGWGFDPVDIVIDAGGTITWRNNGAQVHTVTADDGSFDSGDIAGGGTFKKTFDEPGTFTYFCEPHPWMTGAVRVAAPGEAPPPPAPAAPAASPPGSDTGSDEISRPTSGPTRRGPITQHIKIVEPDLKQVNSWGYAPKQLQAQTGDTVIWTNAGSIPHTVTADDGSFDSGDMSSGATYQRTLTKAGVYSYSCKPHPWMKAVVVVADTPEEAASVSAAVPVSDPPGAVLAGESLASGPIPGAQTAPSSEALVESARRSMKLPVAIGVQALLIALSAAWVLGAVPARQRAR